MTTPTVAAATDTAGPKATPAMRTRGFGAGMLPLRQLAGVGLVLGMIVVLEALGRPAGLEPIVLVPVIAVAATLVGGWVGGGVAAALGTAYAALYYSMPAWSEMGGPVVRTVLTASAAAAGVWLTYTLVDRGTQARAASARTKEVFDEVQAFTLSLADQPDEVIPDSVVAGMSELLQTDMAMLTVLDLQSGRHHIRAIHGGNESAMGVEVLPGVGVTGQALREKRTVIVAAKPSDAAPEAAPAEEGQPNRAAPKVVAAMPVIQQGRVIATLTVGRSDPRRPFTARDRTAMDMVGPVVTLAVAGQLQRQEFAHGSPRDAVTGLYNRAYLDEALDQLFALRRRTPPDARSQLSMVMFDIDGFKLINERHGRQVGDNVLRAVATMIRQRFRASDIAARVGPDSFVVVLNGASAEVAANAAAQIRRQVRELHIGNSNGESVTVSISAGCTAVHDGAKPEALFGSVEAALATARWSGPGAVVSI